MAEYTSIQIYPETRKDLAKLKESSKESYDDIIKKLLELIPKGDEEGGYSEEFRIGLLNARLNLKRGKKISLSKAKAKLGV